MPHTHIHKLEPLQFEVVLDVYQAQAQELARRVCEEGVQGVLRLTDF